MNIKILVLPLLFFGLMACSNANNQDENNSDENAMESDTTVMSQDTVPTGHYGKEISAEGAITPAEFLAAMEGKDSMAVKIKGNIEACCVKKGCWMDLDLENGSTMKVKFKDYAFFVPLDSKGKITVVEGMAYLKETSVGELKHYAEDGGKSQEEIDAITEPQLAYTFIADGVIIE